MLTETIEGFIVRRIEEGTPRPSVLLCFGYLGDIHTDFTVGHGERLEGFSALCHLFQQNLILEIVESNLSSSLIQHGTHGSGGDDEVIALLLYLILCLGVLRHDDETLLAAEALLGSSLHTDDTVVDHLEADLRRTIVLMLFQLYGKVITILDKISCLGTHSAQNQCSRN